LEDDDADIRPARCEASMIVSRLSMPATAV
jgi:hypothetical protein